MSTTLTAPQDEQVAPTTKDAAPREYLWTADEFERACEAGAFGWDRRLELTHGKVIDRMPESPLHAFLVTFIIEVLRARLPLGLWVRTEKPIRIGLRRRSCAGHIRCSWCPAVVPSPSPLTRRCRPAGGGRHLLRGVRPRRQGPALRASRHQRLLGRAAGGESNRRPPRSIAGRLRLHHDAWGRGGDCAPGRDRHLPPRRRPARRRARAISGLKPKPPEYEYA